MASDSNIQPDALINDDQDELARARLVKAMETDPALKREVVKQHFAHGMLHSLADSESGATRRRTQAAMAAIDAPSNVYQFPLWRVVGGIAAVLVFALGVGATLMLTQNDPDQSNEPDFRAALPKTDGDFGIERIAGEAINVKRTDLDNGRRYQNTAVEPITLHFKQGGLVTMDSHASIVVVDGGNRLSEIQGRVAIEGQGTRVSMTELDALVYGGPVVADTGDHALIVYAGRLANAASGEELAIQGQRFDTQTQVASPYDAGKIPAFIASGRSEELFADLQARTREGHSLDSTIWKPVLRELLSAPMGRDLALESVRASLEMDMSDEEIAEMLVMMDYSLQFLVEIGGVEGAVEETRNNVETWRALPKEERAESFRKALEFARKGLQMWRDASPEQREFLRNAWKEDRERMRDFFKPQKD